MKHEQAGRLRLAVAIHAAHEKQQAPPVPVDLPESDWQTCRTLSRRIERARRHRWKLAAARLEADYRWQLQRLREELDNLSASLHRHETAASFASVGDLYQDLAALNEEFEEVTWELRDRTLSVVTEPIELEGVYLGPFEIRLPWGEYARTGTPRYRVIAVDPHPAGTNDSITHPHVQDDELCEGDGRGPLRRALEQGRLYDFFLIVAGIVRTYNDGSPFVALSEWEGRDCSDCGSCVSSEDRWSCEHCGDDLCDDCRVTCPGCESIFCSGCVSRCAECELSYCSGCLPTRPRGETAICASCREELERSDDCHDEQDDEEAAQTAGAPLQPDSLGQAAVSA